MKMTSQEFKAAVIQALAAIPAEFSKYLDSVVVDVESLPSRELLADLDMDDPEELLGIYLGTPLTDRSVEAPPGLPDRVVLFQRNIERMCDTREELLAEIRLTVLHELGHHFGLDEDELDELGYG